MTTVTTGQFFYSSWGYDQTNVDFYKVVGTTAKSVKIQKWSVKVEDLRVVPGDKPATYTDWSAVDRDADYWTQQGQKVERDAKVCTKRVRFWSDQPALTMTSYANAYLWDGSPKYDTRAAGEPGH